MNNSFVRGYWRRFRHVVGGSLIGVLSRFAHVNEQPVFVLGNQKSGTTVIAYLLAKHTGLTSMIDFHYPTAALLPSVHTGELTMNEFIRRHAFYFSRDLIKEPGLTFLFHPLADHFPQAQFVMILRDPRDNIRSLLNRLNIPGHLQEVEPKYLHGLNIIWKRIIHGITLETNGCNYIENMSLRWNIAAEIYLRNAAKIHLIRYEDFCADKAWTIARLAQEMGFPQEYDISDEVDVQHQIRGNRKISWEDFFGIENLIRIERICGSHMNQLGYKVQRE